MVSSISLIGSGSDYDNLVKVKMTIGLLFSILKKVLVAIFLFVVTRIENFHFKNHQQFITANIYRQNMITKSMQPGQLTIQYENHITSTWSRGSRPSRETSSACFLLILSAWLKCTNITTIVVVFIIGNNDLISNNDFMI